MFKSPAPTVLTQTQRYALSHDLSFGGGNVLQAAIAANPHPDVPFIRLARPLTGTDGQPLHELSLLDLDHLAQSWSVWYLAQGVQPRDRVAIYIEDSLAYTVHYLALSQIGAIPVMINGKASSALAAALCRQTTPVGLYSDRGRVRELWRADGRPLQDLRWHEVAEDLPAPPAGKLPSTARFRHAPEDPVSIMHSSGTTGLPKPVVHTHHTVVAGPRFRMLSHNELPGAVMMTALPQAHQGCISYSLYAVLSGTPFISAYDPSGAELAAAVREHQPTSVMAFSHAYGELAALDVPAGAVDSVDTWITMGDAIHEAHIKTILSQRSPELPRAEFWDRLGTTELGWGVLLHVSTSASARKERCVGRPTGSAEVVVLRKDGTLAGPEEFGLLGAKGPAVTVGYWNDLDTNYRSRLSGYWLTGDVVYRDAAGSFFQVDRAVDAIETTGGSGYSVFMEEVVLSGVPEISDCAIVAGRWDTETVAVAVVRSSSGRGDANALLDAANAALRSAGHPQLALLEVVESDADYPVGVTGKVLKRELRERYRDLSAYVAQDAGRILAVGGLRDARAAAGTGARA
jgi:acyl-coenzyme A synthetase/AMP-(fatty) acid ligase